MNKKTATRLNREERRARWAALRAEYLLLGGNIKQVPPFNHNWKAIFHKLIQRRRGA